MRSIKAFVARQLAIFALLGIAFAQSAWSGPEDQGTKYPVGIEIGGLTGGGIVDSGGTTSLSFEDAKKAGLLDANGDPVNPPDGSVNIGGTGGGSVKAHKFKNVTIKVTPRNADGTPSGDQREVKVTVYVPKKPADQAGADDAAKEKKTNSLITKLGSNVAGATVGGGQIKLVDKATSNPLQNERSTGWTNAAPAAPAPVPQKKIPVVPDDNFEDDTIKQVFLPGVLLNGTAVNANLTTLPTTLIPQGLAQTIGLVSVGSYQLDDASLGALFTEGYIDAVPGDTFFLQFGYIDLALPAFDGPSSLNHVAAMINPFSDTVLIGANGLVPANMEGWLDNSSGTFNLIPEPNSLALIVAATLAWGASRRKNGRKGA